MNAPGKTLLKVVSILYIIFGALFALLALFSLFMGSIIASLVSSYVGDISAMLGGAVGFLLFIILLIPAAVDLIVGILGLKKCDDASKANFFIVFGFILGILALISVITAFTVMSLLGLVLPVLLIVGGFMNKNAAKPVA